MDSKEEVGLLQLMDEVSTDRGSEVSEPYSAHSDDVLVYEPSDDDYESENEINLEQMNSTPIKIFNQMWDQSVKNKKFKNCDIHTNYVRGDEKIY